MAFVLLIDVFPVVLQPLLLLRTSETIYWSGSASALNFLLLNTIFFLSFSSLSLLNSYISFFQTNKRKKRSLTRQILSRQGGYCCRLCRNNLWSERVLIGEDGKRKDRNQEDWEHHQSSGYLLQAQEWPAEESLRTVSPLWCRSSSSCLLQPWPPLRVLQQQVINFSSLSQISIPPHAIYFCLWLLYLGWI